MRFLLISLLAVLLVNIVQAQDYFDTTDDYKEEFKGEKVTLGKKKCTCSFMLEVDGDKCSGKGGCDKKCSGSGSVEIGRYSFTLKVKKGKATISKCKAEVESTPLPTTGGSGSGEEPITMPPAPGSGSGEEPITMPPAPGSGSGPGPSPPMGEGMQCRCKCNCPDGSGECDCDCNCPMQSTAMTCASGFTRVCPMVEDACPEDMDMICPMNAASRMGGAEAEGTGKGCQCVPDFLMSLVSPGMPPAAVRLGATAREAVEASIKVGKTQCKCTFDMAVDGLSCKKSKGRCDKKCNGAAKGVELMDGMYMLDMKVKKGKVTIAKCAVTPIALTGTGTGSGTGSGEGAGGMGGMGSRCACVGKGMGGSGPSPPTGSGSGPVPPTGGPVLPTGGPVLPTGGPVLPTEGPVPPTGTGSGSGPAKQKTLPWFLGMDPLELCVETGTEVVFNKTGHNVVLMVNLADYNACTGFLGENPTVGNNIDPFIWQADTDGTFYFACGVGSHCSAGGMKAKITVAPKCSTAKTLPWTFGMQPLVVCVETGTEVIFDKTGSGHNVNQLASESEYNGCTGFTDTQGNSDNPFLYQTDSTGVFYFACGVGSGFHCNNGGMKAMVTVADTCPEE